MAFVRERVTKNRTYYYMVANYRVDGKVKQRTLYLGITRPFKKGSEDEKEYLDCFQKGGSFIIRMTFASKREGMEAEDVEQPGWWLIEGWKDIQLRLAANQTKVRRCQGELNKRGTGRSAAAAA